MRTKIALLLATLFFCGELEAQQQNVKIGVINIQKALSETQEGQKASQELTAKVEPKQKEFTGRQNEIAQLERQLNTSTNLLTDEKKAQLARDLDSKKKRLERDTQDADDALRSEQQSVLQSMSQRLMTLLTKYAKDNGYTLIIATGEPSAPVLYNSPQSDITPEIVTLYDKTYGAGGAKASR